MNGKVVTVARTLDGLLQVQLSKKTKINTAIISQIENELIEPTPQQLAKIKRALPSFDKAIQILEGKEGNK